jgi:hypothetical protein
MPSLESGNISIHGIVLTKVDNMTAYRSDALKMQSSPLNLCIELLDSLAFYRRCKCQVPSHW